MGQVAQVQRVEEQAAQEREEAAKGELIGKESGNDIKEKNKKEEITEAQKGHKQHRS